MQKIVCYFMTRNIYANILPSLKSLLKNGNIDRVYLMIEDDDIGFDLPDKVITMNVGDQSWFRKDGPNYSRKWTYMVMMKAVVCYLLPYEQALTLDVDTIILDDLTPLWGMDMSKYTIAGVTEPHWLHHFKHSYINAGVVMWNLERMRNGRADQLIDAMNTQRYNLVEQDCINEHLHNETLLIDGMWNRCDFTITTKRSPKILHFASRGQERFMQEPVVREYAAMPWEEVFGRRNNGQ